MSEKSIQTSILKYLKKKYPEAIIFKHSDKTRHGIPDIQFIHMSVHIWFEVKDTGKKKNLTQLQDWTLYKLRQNGDRAYVVDSLNDVKEII